MELRISQLVEYAVRHGWITEEDRIWASNRILEVMGQSGFGGLVEVEELPPIHEILDDLCRIAYEKGTIGGSTPAYCDLFDTALMGALMPRPSEISKTFSELYALDPVQATDWYYRFACDSNYIRADRIARDVKWKYPSPYGELDITINLSKPEKDPRAIAAAKLAPQSGYPKCQLCVENTGYAGRLDHPARQNLRPIPITVDGAEWYLQYSPYVYYNEHCIVFNARHVPMKIDGAAFRKLLSFVEKFPHYFVGSNADLPIVGGSILSHEHFQGGHYTFAMATAGIAEAVHFSGFEDVEAGIVNWPMSVLRLRSESSEALVALGEKILSAWRGYTDEDAFIFAETEGEPHNTITPIARIANGKYELDLVLRNNITTEEFPLGVFHPHQDLHHIKKENIGLIEVMGLAVLPARLKTEMADLAKAILAGSDIEADPVLSKHAPWVAELKQRHKFTPDNADEILRQEIGAVFTRVLEDAGVFKTNDKGRQAFRRFIDYVNS